SEGLICVHLRSSAIGTNTIGSQMHADKRLLLSALRLFRLRLARPDDVLDEIVLVLFVRRAVLAEDVVEPNRGLCLWVCLLPRVPREDRLSFAIHESPVDRRDFVLLRDRQNRLECAASRARHIFGAENRTLKCLELLHAFLEFFGLIVAMEGDD